VYYHIDLSGTVAGLKSAIDHVLESNPTSLHIHACDGNDFLKKDLDPYLQSLPVPVCGGIYPRVIVNNHIMEKGSMVVGRVRPANFMVIPDLCDDSIELDKAIDEHFPQSLDVNTVYISVDGLSDGIDRLIEALFNVFGLEVNYLGGGSGSLSLEKKPCVFSSQGLLAGGAVIVASPEKSSIGVRHGFQSIAGPFRITEATDTTIHSLNWEPAFDVYKRVVEAHTEEPFLKSTFLSDAARFPFGINKLKGDMVVRDPLKVLDDSAIVCAGKIYEGGFVDILHGDTRSLIEASRQATEDSLRNMNKSITQPVTLFIDCVSRYLFLGNTFDEEIKNVCAGGPLVLGACTFGEIANNGMKYLELNNKTVVVAQIETI